MTTPEQTVTGPVVAPTLERQETVGCTTVCEHVPTNWGWEVPFMVVQSLRKRAVFDVSDKCMAFYCVSIGDIGD